MKRYKQIKSEIPENFKQLIGLSKEKIQHLCDKNFAKNQQNFNWIKSK
ncbi:hypothetical protein QUF74_10680 [Candidatus Halobeggiatoa sp. HSG11]|nr:hypothetical protein [Candidatus Halobeggiatoa sp. HSG11]